MINMPNDQNLSPLPDAGKDNWVDRFAPDFLKPWLKLARLDRPVGIWLLFLPCLMGAAFDLKTSVLELSFLIDIVLYFVGAVVMRAAGCAVNDAVDRDLDRSVERTKSRPVASGAISRKSALVFAGALSLIGLVILARLGPLSIMIGIGSVFLVIAYPFMKRITWWPQVWLGLTFNIGFLIAFAAQSGTLTLEALVFYLGLVAWTVGYDTIYALQDIEDDALAGIKSSARGLGNFLREGLVLIYLLSSVLIAAALYLIAIPIISWVIYGFFLFNLGAQLAHIKKYPLDPLIALLQFKSNFYAGIFLALIFIADNIWRFYRG